MSYSLHHCHSFHSILDGYSKPRDIIKQAKKLGLNHITITDHGNISGIISTWKEGRKQGVKVGLGCEFYITHQASCIKEPWTRSQSSHILVSAKNKEGFYDLISAVSHSNDPQNFYYRPRLALFNGTYKDTKSYGFEHFCRNGNLIGCSGHMGTNLSSILFADIYDEDHDRFKLNIRTAYSQYKGKDPSFYEQFLRENWLDIASEEALKMQKVFGEGNFFIELQDAYNPNDAIPLTITPLIKECLREVSKQTGIPAICSADAHYAKKEDADLQRLMLLNNMRMNEEEAKAQVEDDSHDTMVFFGSNEFYIPSIEEMRSKFTEEEIENSNKVAALIENYDIQHQPYVPKAQLTVDVSKLTDKVYDICKTDSDKELMYEIIEGAKRLQPWNNPEWLTRPGKKAEKSDYWNQVLKECEIIFEFGLSDYMLLTMDYCLACDYRPADHSFDWRKNRLENGPIDPIRRGQGRGSVGGCLIAYFIGITGKKIDPLLYDLKFVRFLNKGRLSKDHVSLCDVDTDITVEGREWLISYLRNKYGQDKVSQVITFGKMSGRSSIKDVFKIKGVPNHFEVANEITKTMPIEGAISDELQEAREETGDEDFGIIDWCKKNNPEFIEIYEKSPYKNEIELASLTEGTIRSCGRHPSAIGISPVELDKLYPMQYDSKSKTKIIGFSFKEAEEVLGLLKADILGLSALSKIDTIEKMINNGNMEKNT